MLTKYDKLPDFMKNKKVKYYYDILSKKRLQLLLKRLFDILMSLILLIILFPILLIISIIIKIDSKGPIFYRQIRITKYSHSFLNTVKVLLECLKTKILLIKTLRLNMLFTIYLINSLG